MPSEVGGLSDEPLSFVPPAVLGGGSDANADYITTMVTGGLSNEPANYIPTFSLGGASDEELDYLVEDLAPSRPREIIAGRAHTRTNQDAVLRVIAKDGIDLRSATTYLLTAPGAGTRIVLEAILLECLSGTAITSDAVVSIITSDSVQLRGPTALTNFRNAGNLIALRPSGVGGFAPTNGDLRLVVETPAVGSVLLVRAHVLVALLA